MVRAVAEKGFESVGWPRSWNAPASRAPAFYELFEDKEECLFAAHERVIDALVAYVGRRLRGPTGHGR